MTAPVSVLQNVLNALPDPILLLDERRRVLMINDIAATLLGHPDIPEDLSFIVRTPEILHLVNRGLEQNCTQCGHVALSTLHPGPFEALLNPIAIGGLYDDVQSAALLILRDLSMQRKVEQMRRDFVINVSHELRSPLSSIIGFLETLNDTAREDAEIRERFMAIMMGEARRMSDLIEDLLALSMVELNEHVRPHGQVSVMAVIESARKALSLRAQEREMEIIITPPDAHESIVHGDERELERVFHNLIDNAIKYADPKTAVRVSIIHTSFLDEREVRVAVNDRGQGISPIDIPRLTERFFRVDATRSQQVSSTGLGLAICKHIINRHRGRLLIESTPQEGSTFTVCLPSIVPVP